ncbi:FixH family protein [Sphingomonas desiccabilis]|uniref:FixH family protein n=1 Tax=Sphingomonas desiccabilis TaxID=429134 RepID=UPI001825E7E8|nr:FixH family protein [Sphingomonas desiccabilis]MBB3910465.1 nitrogen fixation protein FixH [Sphingomonas desiccabilis]
MISPRPAPARRFTGWHMLAILLGMFGTIIAVNVVMARFAVGTFGGTVVDNSYVASQKFNHWLAEARAQEALGWKLQTRVDEGRILRITTSSPMGPLYAATMDAVAIHPLGRAPERKLHFVNAGGGTFASQQPLPEGRWLLRIEVREGRNTARFDDQVGA